ncbi:unnamed protein product, partial [Adineta steineri]
MTDSAE